MLAQASKLVSQNTQVPKHADRVLHLLAGTPDEDGESFEAINYVKCTRTTYMGGTDELDPWTPLAVFRGIDHMSYRRRMGVIAVREMARHRYRQSQFALAVRGPHPPPA